LRIHIVMAGLVPAIHVFGLVHPQIWFGTSSKDVDARDERGHDDNRSPD
jgi:hypothetical protein